MVYYNPQRRLNYKLRNNVNFSERSIDSKRNKMRSLFIIGILSLSIITLVALGSINNNNSNVFAQNATNKSSSLAASSSTTGFDCASLPSKISKNAAALQNPNKDVCDIVILRQAPQIIGHNGTILNKFLAINSLVEFMKAPSNMSSGSSNSNSPNVIVMGEFGLLQTELKPVLLAMSQAKWNITAVHNHPIMEKPPMIFVHWDTLGSLNTITNQIREIASLDQTLSQQQQQQQSQSGNNNNSGNTTSGNPLSAIGKQLGGALGLGNNK
jgi:cytoskeletal protein RodZ